MLPLAGHLGAQVSALVDDQLNATHAARAWRHVEGCAGCRAAVEQELWVKQRLAQAGPVVPQPVLTGALSVLPDAAPRGWPLEGAPPSRRHGGRRAGLAALGVGTVSAALVGLGGLALDGEGTPNRSPSATVEGRTPTAPPSGGMAARLGLPRP